MTTRTKLSRRTVLLAFAALALLIVSAVGLLLRSSKTPRVTATFLNFADTLRPRLAQFAVTNHSSRLIHLIGYRFAGDSRELPYQAQSIPPRQSFTVSLDIPPPLAAHTHLELLFRRQDTAAEEAREMLDSVLHSIGIRWPGLNPDSHANQFHITSSIPPNAPTP